MVVNLMASIGGITDIEALQAGMLHDTVEDTETSPEEIETRFGYAVRSLVMEVTDDKKLEKQERKWRQIEKAPGLSPRAKTIKLADKIANLTDLIASPPADWPLERQQQYVDWSNKVIAWKSMLDSADWSFSRQRPEPAAAAVSRCPSNRGRYSGDQ
jgi:guanosine-3',5'-bis(diphosphate) 3'-pyrophosphohydrolase